MNSISFLIVMLVLLIGSLTIATLIVIFGLWLLDKDKSEDND